MKKIKKIIGLLGITIIMISLFSIPVKSWNIWDVQQGITRFYYFTETYSGNINGITQYPAVRYEILLNKQFGQAFILSDTNNTDVFLKIDEISDTNRWEFFMTLYDDLYNNNPNSLILSDLDNLNSIFSQALMGSFLLPVRNNSFFWIFISFDCGMNWSISYEKINALSNYNSTWNANLLVINCTKNNVFDSSIEMYYNITKTIIWDNSTGFFVSLTMQKIYEDNFFTVTSTITSQSSYSQQQVPIILSTSETFWVIALAVSGISAVISILFYFKIKKK
ncbi:MAG: hypothetical protein ACTSPY_10815 [Candidatus Helarchaeota archaeon]